MLWILALCCMAKLSNAWNKGAGTCVVVSSAPSFMPGREFLAQQAISGFRDLPSALLPSTTINFKIESTANILGILINAKQNNQPFGSFVANAAASQQTTGSNADCTGQAMLTHTTVLNTFTVPLAFAVPAAGGGDMVTFSALLLVGTSQSGGQKWHYFEQQVSFGMPTSPPDIGPACMKQGPSSSMVSHALPTMKDVCVTAIASVGDTIGTKPDGSPYRLVGAIDGIAALPDNSNPNQFFIFCNHEISASLGATRAHGQTGAFVTKLTVNKADLKVVAAQDLVQSPKQLLSSKEGWLFSPPSMSRLCSSDIPPISAIYNSKTKKGSLDRLYFAGEEDFNGRAFTFVADGPQSGNVYTLPFLGRSRWENIVLNPYEQDLTIAALSDDRFPRGIVVIYVGQKTDVGNPAQRAGLVGGDLYGISVFATLIETEAAPLDGRFELVKLNEQDVTLLTDTQLMSIYDQKGATYFLRPEDTAWHPRAPRRLILATTDRVASRLYRLEFDDITDPLKGGTIKSLLKPVVGLPNINNPQYVSSLDNVAVDGNGNVVMCEDGGAGAPNRLLVVEGGAGAPDATNTVTVNTQPINYGTKTIAVHNPDFFGDASKDPVLPYTRDNEFSGIFDASHILGPGWYLMANQAHGATTSDVELLEQGQLMAIQIPISKQVPPTPAQTYPAVAPTPTSSVMFPDILTDAPEMNISPTDAPEGGIKWWHVVLVLVGVVCCFAICVFAIAFSVRRSDEYESHRQEMSEEWTARPTLTKEPSRYDVMPSPVTEAPIKSIDRSRSKTAYSDGERSASDDSNEKQTPQEEPKEEPQQTKEEAVAERKSRRKSRKSRKSLKVISVDEVTAAAKEVVGAAAQCVKSEGVRDLFVPAARSVSSATKSLVKKCEGFSSQCDSTDHSMIKESAHATRHAVVDLVKAGKALMIEATDEEAKKAMQTAGANVARNVKSLLEIVNNATIEKQ